ncbi:hypothetical protein Tcan_12447 [Toxocara canis]|uniref:Uncharacterized protein n=1 Tax=Toxocara canis TaxID=6265 RepID=A0A0B2V8P9_TOXCA|nr:hypothetical protein Tcan_12447 [Toxocara canis]
MGKITRRIGQIGSVTWRRARESSSLERWVTSAEPYPPAIHNRYLRRNRCICDGIRAVFNVLSHTADRSAHLSAPLIPSRYQKEASVLLFFVVPFVFCGFNIRPIPSC